MKAYVDKDGQTRMFRPEMNMKRFNDSSSRLCLPNFNGGELLECIKELLRVDREWIPTKRGYSMYLRPVIFSTTPWLGLTQCSEAMILVLMSPVGPYFKSGFVPIKLSVDAKYIRAWPGGTGNIKYGGNYGSTVISQKNAAKGGASQSLYVYDVDEFVTEAGTMNIFFLWTNTEGVKELVTPTLADGTILPGVTRQSVIDLAIEWGECTVAEKMLPFAEVAAAFERGEVWEIFGTGTAAVVQPVGTIMYRDKIFSVPEAAFQPGSFQLRLTNELYGIQYGEIPHPWSIVL
jgi:branched-chain amino acid aminotransferase